jgi:hypothetical protein
VTDFFLGFCVLFGLLFALDNTFTLAIMNSSIIAAIKKLLGFEHVSLDDAVLLNTLALMSFCWAKSSIHLGYQLNVGSSIVIRSSAILELN